MVPILLVLLNYKEKGIITKTQLLKIIKPNIRFEIILNILAISKEIIHLYMYCVR